MAIGAAGIISGNGTVTGTVVNGGSVRPGELVGALSVTGSYSQTSVGELRIDLGGTAANEFDKLSTAGPVTLNGSLRATLVDLGAGTFTPAIGDEVEFLAATAGVTGEFRTLILPALTADRTWRVRYAADAASLVVTLPGDFDIDGDVDGQDLVKWRGDFGSNGHSDADADGDSDGADYLIWQRHLGETAPTMLAVAAPEPAAIALATISWWQLAMTGRRRRRGAAFDASISLVAPLHSARRRRGAPDSAGPGACSGTGSAPS